MNSGTATRYGVWKIQPDPDGLDEYVVVCVSEAENGTVCGLDSGSGDMAAFVEWARRHRWTHPDHRTYRLVADVQMVMVPEVEPL
ncbi:hypothetical protein [Kitasatospora sp. NPDC088779]|uniref:DUF7848 domain-containing protein n=1 Tax=Kitasatospora sp. NPDC088779 TaxID=3154964 RepID=UPI003449A924